MGKKTQQHSDIDVEKEISGGDELNLSTFFAKVEDLRNTLETIMDEKQKITLLYQHILEAVREDQRSEYNNKVSDEMEKIRQYSNKMRGELKALRAENDRLQKKYGNGEPNVRIRNTQYAQLVNNFLSVMNEYQEIQLKYKESCKEALKTHYLIVNPNATTDEMKTLLENADSENLLESKQLFDYTKSSVEAESALKEMKAQQKGILNIEKSLKDLNQLFFEMSYLVEQQGDLVNQIDTHVNNAVTYTDKAATEIRGAVREQKKLRRKKIYIAVILVLLIVIIAAVLYVYLFKSDTQVDRMLLQRLRQPDTR